jgi:hypothetical protein
MKPVHARAYDDTTLREQGLRELVSEGRLAGTVDAVDRHAHPSFGDLGNVTGDVPEQDGALRTHRRTVAQEVVRARQGREVGSWLLPSVHRTCPDKHRLPPLFCRTLPKRNCRRAWRAAAAAPVDEGPPDTRGADDWQS